MSIVWRYIFLVMTDFFYESGEMTKLISILRIKAIKRIVRYIDICFFMVNNIGYHFC